MRSIRFASCRTIERVSRSTSLPLIGLISKLRLICFRLIKPITSSKVGTFSFLNFESNHAPADNRCSSSNLNAVTCPCPFVVRATSPSCIITNFSSFVIARSVSSQFTLYRGINSNAAIVFSGANVDIPRCAIILCCPILLTFLCLN